MYYVICENGRLIVRHLSLKEAETADIRSMPYVEEIDASDALLRKRIQNFSVHYDPILAYQMAVAED